MRDSSLGHRAGRSPTDPAVIERMAKDAYHMHGVVVVRLAEIEDPWERQVVVNLAERKWGRRDRG